MWLFPGWHQGQTEEEAEHEEEQRGFFLVLLFPASRVLVVAAIPNRSFFFLARVLIYFWLYSAYVPTALILSVHFAMSPRLLMIHNEMCSNKRKKYRQKRNKMRVSDDRRKQVAKHLFIGMETEGDLTLYIGRSYVDSIIC